MRQLTLRGFDPQLETRLVELARARSISLNRAALELMRRGAGIGGGEPPGPESSSIGTALDKFIGVWSQSEEEEFLRSIENLERIDSELWE